PSSYNLMNSGINSGGCCISESIIIVASPFACSNPQNIADSLPKFLEKEMYLTLESEFAKVFIIFNELSVEPSFIKISSKSYGKLTKTFATFSCKIEILVSSLKTGTTIEINITNLLYRYGKYITFL